MHPDFAKNFLQNILTTWVDPELSRRRESGLITGNLELNKAQIIFTVDGHQIIRLNSEIRATIQTDGRLVKDMSVNFDNTKESVQAVDRIKGEEDFGHITIVKVRDLWTIAFDFRYGINYSKSYFDLGIEFLDAAVYSCTNKRYHAAATSLYIAIENLMRARILLYPDEEVRKLKTHKTMAGKVNIHYKMDTVVKSEEREAYNLLKRIYDKGASRYSPNSQLNPQEIEGLLKSVTNFSHNISSLYSASLVYKD